jgi:hypothetical protein
MNRLSLIVAVLIAAGALLFGGPAMADPATFDPSALLIGMAAVMPAGRSELKWQRKRDWMKSFSNVPAGVPAVVTTVFSAIPRLKRTLLGVQLELGGTTFTKALISRIELFLGETSIFGPVTGTELDEVDTYVDGQGYRAKSDFFLPIDFHFKNIIEQGGAQIGGLDLNLLPAGDLRLEVDMAVGVSAPTIRGDAIWGVPQGSGQFAGLMRKLVKRGYAQAPSGEFEPDVKLAGAIIARSFCYSAVATAAVSTAQSSEGVANTGDGVMGAITVTARTRTGRYKLRFIEPAANAGRFVVEDPSGVIIGTGTVAVAFSAGGLAFTLADGATDFVAGDGFFIDVLPLNTNQNVNAIEIKKNDDLVYKRTDKAARFEQGRWGRTPLSQLFVADFIVDNRIDSVLDTKGAESLDYKLGLTAADTITMLHDVLAEPLRFSRSADQ